MSDTDHHDKDTPKQSSEKDEEVVHVMTSNPEQHHYISTTTGGGRSTSKKLSVLLVVFVLVAIAIGAYSFSSGGSKSPTSVSSSSSSTPIAALAPAEVSITSSGFVPATVSVKVGQAVTWTNNDSSLHMIASDPYPSDNALADFKSKQPILQNDQFSFVFDKLGTYTYHDDLNPYTLQGTVIVKQ